MNIAKKVYCRVFQQAFHIAIPFLPYRRPEIFDNATALAAKFKSLGLKHALIVTDPFMGKSAGFEHLRQEVFSSGLDVSVYSDVVANPTDRNVEEARERYLSAHCDCLIGFGGGSAIDSAKAVGARIACPNKPLIKMEGILKVLRKIPPLAAIPTTAGTGSETTLAAVIVDERTRHKYAINSFPLIPRYAVLDPEYTLTLPKNLTATTGMDALTHAVEAYIGLSTTKKTRSDALLAVSLIFKYLERAYNDGSDREARENMLKASYHAGAAFTVSYVGYCHAVAHSLGGKYNIPHGLANAVLLPYVLKEYGKSAERKLSELSLAAGVGKKGASDKENASSFIAAIEMMNKDMGIPEKLGGIRKEDVEELSRKADREANPLYPVPREMDAKELEVFYWRVMA